MSMSAPVLKNDTEGMNKEYSQKPTPWELAWYPQNLSWQIPLSSISVMATEWLGEKTVVGSIS